jgi:hypothetical protein
MQGHDPRFGQPYTPPPPQQHGSHAVYPQPAAPVPSQGGWGGQLAAQANRMGGGALGSMGNVMGGAGIKMGAQPSGLPAPLAFGLGLVAVVVALVFDVIFLHVHIPGVGSYAWYLTTALSFAGAGWAAIKWTRASKTVAMTALAVAASIYGVADLGLGLVLENLSMAGAIMLGAQGVGIGLFTGFGGVFKALRERDE